MKSLRAEELEKVYKGRKVIDRVSLRLDTGEIVGLLGPNGAGKTTIFSIITGIVKPSGGKVFLDSLDITNLPMANRAKHGLCYLPQEPSIFRKLTVEENIMAILEFQPITSTERYERLSSLLNELNIEYIAKQKASTLSGGERRRVEIARALATSPTFILLDEPFAGIDPISIVDLQQIIFHLRKKNIGVLITDHNVQHTLEVCNRVYIINDGVILKSGSPQEVAASEEVRSIYLGERFRFDFNKTEIKGVEKRWIHD